MLLVQLKVYDSINITATALRTITVGFEYYTI
jgi:hypothetical protein